MNLLGSLSIPKFDGARHIACELRSRDTRAFAGLLFLLAVSLAAPAWALTAWDHVAKVVVMGDLHGDYAKFHDMLIEAGLIDGHDNWSGGATHLVQVGDVPDQYARHPRSILDLLIRLEPQARRAGGYVHALIGNHEAMNMEGDLRYTTPAEFVAFADRDSAAPARPLLRGHGRRPEEPIRRGAPRRCSMRPTARSSTPTTRWAGSNTRSPGRPTASTADGS